MHALCMTFTILLTLLKCVGNQTCKARGTGNGYGRHGTARNCIFPFIMSGKRYKGCAPNRRGSYCATRVDSRGNCLRWARCNKYCRRDNGRQPKGK